jgi:hypothetical protein
MPPPPTHDLWINILDLVDSSDLKACNRVCSVWHSYLQPQLLASIAIDWKKGPLIAQIKRILRPHRHRMRRLCILDWPAPRQCGPFIAAFTQVTELELHGLRFGKSADFGPCFSSIGDTLQKLYLVDCELGGVLQMIQNSMSNPAERAKLAQMLPRFPALQEVHLSSSTGESFTNLILQWLYLSENLECLRKFRIGIINTRFPWNSQPRLLSLISKSECKIERLELIRDSKANNRGPPIFNSECIH